MIKINFKNKLILLAIIFLFVIYAIILTKRYTTNRNEVAKTDVEYIKSLNIHLKGSIINIYELERYKHNFGIITIIISESSIKYLDERKERKRFLGIIKNNVGNFIVGTISDFQLGDSIEIKSNFYNLFRNNRKVVSARKITLPIDPKFKPYNDINNKLKYIK